MLDVNEGEVITHDNPLKSRVKVTGSGDVNTDVIKKAEDNLKRLSTQFDIWLEDEIIRLKHTRDDVKKNGLVPPYDEKLYNVCHDLKGQGETFGYPMVSTICGNLCKLIDAAPERAKLPIEIIDNHIDAVSNIGKNKIKVATDAKSLNVVNRLQEVVQEFVDYVDEKNKKSEETS